MLWSALLSSALTVQASPTVLIRHIGVVYEVTRVTESSSMSSDGGSSSSTDRDTITERLIAIRPDGLELEYDLPRRESAADRARQWDLPVRLLQPAEGPPKLLNEPELAARLAIWLKRGKIPRSACGTWIFTWNAFKIECEPASVIKTIAAFTIGNGPLRDGGEYRDDAAQAPGLLHRMESGAYIVVLSIDPEAVRREQAEADVIVAKLSGTPITLEAARQARVKDRIEGTLTVTIEADTTGRPEKRTTITKLVTTRPNGRVETRTSIETLERRAVQSTGP